MDNLAAIFGVVQKRLGVNIRTQTVKALSGYGTWQLFLFLRS